MKDKLLQLNQNEIMMYESMNKNKFVAYVIGAFFGTIGLHRLYLKEYIGFAIYVILFLLSFEEDKLFTFIVAFWLFDFVYTWFMCDKYNTGVVAKIIHSRTTRQSTQSDVL